MGCNTLPMPPEPERPGQRKVFLREVPEGMPGLDEPPFDTELGGRIYENVSEEAWKMWGRALQDDLERIPAESRQPAGPGDPGQAPGRFLLRRGRRASTGIRPPAQQGLISGFYARSEDAADLDLRTGPATVWAGLARGVATR